MAKKRPNWYEAIAQREGLVKVDRGNPIEEYARKAKIVFEAALARKSPETVKAYQRAVRFLGQYMGFEDAGVTDTVQRLIALDRLDADILLQAWVARMESDNLSPATINQRLAGVRFYVHLAKRAGWVSWEVEVEGPKAEKVKDTRGPTRDEFVDILKVTHALEGETASRNRLMIYMFAFMALRVDSVLSIDIEHIDIRRSTVKVKWKGKKQRVARPIPDHTLGAMKVWLKERGKHAGPLFKSFDLAEKGDGRLTRRSAHRIVARIGKRAGIDGLHPHSFRHFSATEALELSDGNRHKTRKHTGHSSDKVLDLYDDERDDLARDMAQTIEDEWLG